MKWASAISEKPEVEEAIAELTADLSAQLQGQHADLLIAFASPAHAADPSLPARLSSRFPGVKRTTFHLDGVSLPDPQNVDGWRAAIGASLEERPNLLLLVDPFTCDPAVLLSGLDRAYPGLPKFGGLASGGRAAGQNRLFLGGEALRRGVVGVALSGNLAVETIVAQGCRPIGRPMLVTRCEGNRILQLDQRPPLEVLGELHDSLPPRDQALFRGSLFLGIEMHADQVEHREGELLARHLIGAEASTGALVVGAQVHPFQVVQFLVRDAQTAAEDLTRVLERCRTRAGTRPPDGALLFSCLGRGEHLFGRVDHDTDLFRSLIGPVPLGGFFCNGEIGPVGGVTFLHGYTSAFALFREPAKN